MSDGATAGRPIARRFDPFLDDDGLRRTYRALLAGRWDDFVNRLGTDRTGWLASSIMTSEEAAIETIVFRRLVDARPSALTLTLLGAAQARDAWSLVGGYETLGAVSAARRDEFERQMTEAESVLNEAITIRPALTEPRVHLLSTGRGLQIGLRKLRTRFEDVHTRVPFRPDATREYLLSLSYRGGGNDAAMFDFARWVESEAPTASPAHLALPAAHIEHGLGASRLRMTDHLSQPETVTEIAKALAAFLAATPEVATSAELITLNAFALAMTVESQETAELTAECLRRIDNRPTAYPWVLYEEDVAAVFNEIRRSQFRSIARFSPD